MIPYPQQPLIAMVHSDEWGLMSSFFIHSAVLMGPILHRSIQTDTTAVNFMSATACNAQRTLFFIIAPYPLGLIFFSYNPTLPEPWRGWHRLFMAEHSKFTCSQHF